MFDLFRKTIIGFVLMLGVGCCSCFVYADDSSDVETVAIEKLYEIAQIDKVIHNRVQKGIEFFQNIYPKIDSSGWQEIIGGEEYQDVRSAVFPVLEEYSLDQIQLLISAFQSPEQVRSDPDKMHLFMDFMFQVNLRMQELLQSRFESIRSILKENSYEVTDEVLHEQISQAQKSASPEMNYLLR